MGRHGDAWKVRVGVAPERGKANAGLLAVLATQLGVRRSQLTIVSGQTARDKIVELRGLSIEDAAARLGEAARSRETS